MTLRRATATAALLLGLVAPAAPADAAVVHRRVSGWLPYWSAASYQHFMANADLFRAVSPFWYRADSATSIYAHPGAGNATWVRGAHSKGVPVVPTITETMSATAMVPVLTNATQRSAHVGAIVGLVMGHGYDGIDVDYEQFVVTTNQNVANANKAGFTAFVRDLCGRLKARGKQCVITVNARTDDAMQASYRPSHAVGVFDYAAIAAAASTMRIMTYGQHYPAGSPGPVAGIGWVDAVARYTVSKTGGNKAKVELGIAQVGYNWGRPGVKADPMTYPQVVAKARDTGAVVKWSSAEQAPYFAYRGGDGYVHTVWYDDAYSASIRARRARSYGLAGAAIWFPGIEDARLWGQLRALATY